MPSLGDRMSRLRWLAVPIGVYLMVTLVLPAANGAAGRGDFGWHAACVMAGCIALVASMLIGGVLADWIRHNLRRSR